VPPKIGVFFGGGLLIRPASVFNRFLEWLPPP